MVSVNGAELNERRIYGETFPEGIEKESGKKKVIKGEK